MLNTEVGKELFDRGTFWDLGGLLGATHDFAQAAKIQDSYFDRHATAILPRNTAQNGRTADTIGW
jgi:hypothetical protein